MEINHAMHHVTSANRSILILFAHGARDPRWAEPFLRIQQMIAALDDTKTVHLAFLEFMTPSLPDLVAQLMREPQEQSRPEQQHEITLVPLFLGQGGHVLRDLPRLIDELEQTWPQLRLRRMPAVGEDEAVLAAISQYCLRCAATPGVEATPLPVP
jgi:sirohydrochlorin cobaltochelatase